MGVAEGVVVFGVENGPDEVSFEVGRPRSSTPRPVPISILETDDRPSSPAVNLLPRHIWPREC